MVRIKHRYVIAQALHESEPAEELTGRELILVIREKLQLLYGDMGAGEFGGNTTIKFFDGNTQIYVLRTAREAEHSARLAMSTVTQVKGSPLVLRTLSVAGCGRTCLNKLRALLDRALEAEVATRFMDESTHSKRKAQYEALLLTLEL
jgi:RNase P/RNase MRP subunit POP5